MKLGRIILPEFTDAAVRQLANVLDAYLRRVADKVDGLAQGRIGDRDSAAPTPPQAGAWARGDFVSNSAPAVLGTAGARYTVAGWTRVTTGTSNVPGTDWVEARTLTGT